MSKIIWVITKNPFKIDQEINNTNNYNYCTIETIPIKMYVVLKRLKLVFMSLTSVLL